MVATVLLITVAALMYGCDSGETTEARPVIRESRLLTTLHTRASSPTGRIAVRTPGDSWL
jgi:hypothetical protein